MKSRKIMIIVASIIALLSIGGCTVKHKDDTKQGKTMLLHQSKKTKKPLNKSSSLTSKSMKKKLLIL